MGVLSRVKLTGRNPQKPLTGIETSSSQAPSKRRDSVEVETPKNPSRGLKLADNTHSKIDGYGSKPLKTPHGD